MRFRKIGPTAPGTYTENYKNNIEKYIHLKLAFMQGCKKAFTEGNQEFLSLSNDLIANFLEKKRLLSDHLCPTDKRIQDFLKDYFADIEDCPDIELPKNSLLLDRHGLAREMSLPKGEDIFQSEWVKSVKVEQGVVNNPMNDRRTTKGVFHIVEDGLPIPGDKKAVPRVAFAKLFNLAMNPPSKLSGLPWLQNVESVEKEMFVSLLLRPKVVPGIAGVSKEKSMEIRFFAPGGLVSNLDFVESIFGNAGDPELPINDAGLDPDSWTGHTGCVILAPHLKGISKKDCGLPHFKDASERQKRDGMCWEKEDENYNEGQAFKICCRDKRGVIVTIIADNYYGYCKKEVKTQIGYSANLFGLAEEEHAGGAIVYPSYHLGFSFQHVPYTDHSYKHVLQNMKSEIIEKDGYAIDKNYDNVIYVPENSLFDIHSQSISHNGEEILKLLPNKVYMLPTGYRVSMEKHPAAPSWRLIGTEPEGTLCHKPSTVSGGGKSEISKSFSDSYIFGPLYIDDIDVDFNKVQEIFDKDYFYRFNDVREGKKLSRSLLDQNRSLGSVIKLLTVSSDYTDEYNEWLSAIPSRVLSLVYIVKRFYKAEWGGEWRKYFTVDIVNGSQGHELKYEGRKVAAVYVRMGFGKDGSWRTFKLRQDFIASQKIQVEDDITCSITVSSDTLSNKNSDYPNECVKLVQNCEYRLFQRPDEAVNRGFDKQAESDLGGENLFISNFEPMNSDQARELIEDSVNFESYTNPIKKVIKTAAEQGTRFISSAHPRIVDGKPSKNPRYLQTRADLVDPFNNYTAHMGTRLKRLLKPDEFVYNPVNAVLMGHRNNPPEKDKGVRSLAVYNPLHYLDTPELFMDFICSLTGKSPSTTGAGSEGALTKGPFNALCTTTDLNNALVSYLLTDYSVFCSAAGHIGPDVRVDHDISLFIPEIWGRIDVEKRNHKYLIENGYLDKIEDFDHEGKTVLASRLGYRISEKFVQSFMGKIFDNPVAVFNESILKPETQDLESFVDGINNIVEAQKKVALQYFDDESIGDACPPLKILLHIMAYGHYENKNLTDPEIRAEFKREKMLASDWYKTRLINKQANDILYWEKSYDYLKSFQNEEKNQSDIDYLHLDVKTTEAEESLKKVKSTAYLKSLNGTIGLDGIH